MRWNLWTLLSVLSLLFGLLFFIGMGLSFGNWTDVGVYSVTIVLLGLGGFGLLASQHRPAGEA